MPKKNKLLPQYRGALSAFDIVHGMNLAIGNARRLHSDAKLMLQSERFASAVALASLSIEESGKLLILRNIAISDEKNLPEHWREYRSHTKKNAMWIFGSLAANGARKITDFSRMFDDNSDHPDVLDTYKQLALYTDCLGTGKWVTPLKAINPETAAHLVNHAGQMVRDRDVTLREIELWQHYIKPGMNTAQMQVAVLMWHKAMVQEGLSDMGEDELQDFISL